MFVRCAIVYNNNNGWCNFESLFRMRRMDFGANVANVDTCNDKYVLIKPFISTGCKAYSLKRHVGKAVFDIK